MLDKLKNSLLRSLERLSALAENFKPITQSRSAVTEVLADEGIGADLDKRHRHLRRIIIDVDAEELEEADSEVDDRNTPVSNVIHLADYRKTGTEDEKTPA